MLNEFSTVKIDAKKTEAPQGATAAPAAGAPAEEALSEEEFAKQLQAGMADLLGELEKSVTSNPSRVEYIDAH